MTSWFTRLTAGVLLLAAANLTSCKKDESQVVIKPTAAPALTASTTTPNLALTTTNSNATAATFTYTAANFGYQSATTYTLQFDKKGGNFSSPVSYPGGTAAGAITLTTAQLVKVFTNLGYTYNSTSQVDARVVATVGNASAPQQASPVVTITGTPTPLCVANTFGGSWSLIGPAGDGWSSDRALTYDCYTQTFTLRSALNAGEFKFRANNDWSVNLGGNGDLSKGAALTTNGPNLSIATAGTYTITLSVNTDASGAVVGGTAVVK
ncbi:SusE domain-containing protein [Hymenobacter sp. BRD128]|uniref:SusE domain-containing protein n=1 Tax=Hymenobacter sp. BRD128 TaxID=2675878 RepID=UPI001563D6CD|nr:SusE domain-containing protein [Hymenobacter sp. BRD128]QKG55899.1 SusE domain-containing protein [Hymenobacter sp. BRD128]